MLTTFINCFYFFFLFILVIMFYGDYIIISSFPLLFLPRKPSHIPHISVSSSWPLCFFNLKILKDSFSWEQVKTCWYIPVIMFTRTTESWGTSKGNISSYFIIGKLGCRAGFKPVLEPVHGKWGSINLGWSFFLSLAPDLPVFTWKSLWFHTFTFERLYKDWHVSLRGFGLTLHSNSKPGLVRVTEYRLEAKSSLTSSFSSANYKTRLWKTALENLVWLTGFPQNLKLSINNEIN